MALPAPQPQREEWESSRAAEPVDFPAILFGVLSKTLESPLGSKERHRRLQDLESLLYAHIAIDASRGGKYREMIRGAVRIRDQIAAGKVKGVHPSESVDMFQKLWLEGLVSVMKRRNLLGEDWRRG